MCLLWWFLMTGFPANQPTIDVFRIMGLSKHARKGKNTHTHTNVYTQITRLPTECWLVASVVSWGQLCVCLLWIAKVRKQHFFTQTDWSTRQLINNLINTNRENERVSWGLSRTKSTSHFLKLNLLGFSPDCMFVYLTVTSRVTRSTFRGKESLWNNVRAEKSTGIKTQAHTLTGFAERATLWAVRRRVMLENLGLVGQFSLCLSGVVSLANGGKL